MLIYDFSYFGSTGDRKSPPPLPDSIKVQLPTQNAVILAGTRSQTVQVSGRKKWHSAAGQRAGVFAGMRDNLHICINLRGSRRKTVGGRRYVCFEFAFFHGVILVFVSVFMCVC